MFHIGYLHTHIWILCKKFKSTLIKDLFQKSCLKTKYVIMFSNIKKKLLNFDSLNKVTWIRILGYTSACICSIFMTQDRASNWNVHYYLRYWRKLISVPKGWTLLKPATKEKDSGFKKSTWKYFTQLTIKILSHYNIFSVKLRNLHYQQNMWDDPRNP